jgi:hypothetical protein
MFPHLDHPSMPENSMADAERWAAAMPVPGYAIDDQTAIQVVEDTVEVISEGHWKLFALTPMAPHFASTTNRPENGIRPFASLTANRCRVGRFFLSEGEPLRV